MIDTAALELCLRDRALAFPDASEHFPWGERVVKVGRGARPKIFLFLSHWQGGLNIGLKLPSSREFALMFEACTPMRYGLGKSGWVTTRLLPDTVFDTDLLESWLAESYRAVAPRRLAARIAEGGTPAQA
ncbi:MAG: MmcQ/YjbR family DNA-binding protein [Sphingomonadaceae bacterium]